MTQQTVKHEPEQNQNSREMHAWVIAVPPRGDQEELDLVPVGPEMTRLYTEKWD